ncbi:hypothetical protein SAMD00019534_086620, partial [Acytostelium subglobosum LB1]|uniref:hypothetical protein n=1 Tax=Acytostelium subglobosum LB1 TaxID=1410327 RepID=UPI000644DE68
IDMSTKKVCVITGGNNGIGKETIKLIAKQHPTDLKIILCCRTIQRGEEVVNEIKEFSNNQDINVMQLDLSSFQSIRDFVKNFKELGLPLNYLIDCAGVVHHESTLTADGYEGMFGTNHLGHFLLTNSLLDVMEKSDEPRITVVSSRAHTSANLKLEELPKQPVGFRGYANSKLCNIMYTYELQRRLDEKGSKIVVNTLHPGSVHETELNRSSWIVQKVFPLFAPFITSLRDSAIAVSELSLGERDDLRGVKGKYFFLREQYNSNNFSKKPENWLQLWNKSAEYTGIPSDIQ